MDKSKAASFYPGPPDLVAQLGYSWTYSGLSCIHREGTTSHSHLNQATMKTQTTITGVTITSNGAGYFDIVTAKGKEVEITPWLGKVHVKVINRMAKVYRSTNLGKPYATLADAVENYKNADVKHALRVLVSELV